MENSGVRRLANRSDFEQYVRTGEHSIDASTHPQEHKFNPNHDPANGRFTYAPGASGSPKSVQGNRQRSIRKTKPMAQAQIEVHAQHAMSQYQKELSRGVSAEEAAAWAANSEAESGNDPTKHQLGGGPGRGLFQWGDPRPSYDRRATFLRIMKIPVERATVDQQLAFRDWELRNTHRSTKRHIDSSATVGDKSRAITRYYLGPADIVGASEDRARIAEAILRKART